MALFLFFCQLSFLLEPIPRPDPASVCKILAKEGLRETITFLGWFINTRLLIISLQAEKTVAWSNKIRDIMAKRKAVKHKDIQRLI